MNSLPLPSVTGHIILALLLVAAALLVYVIVRGPRLSVEHGGAVLLLVALFVLPAIVLASGFGESLQRSSSTEFCLSCHEMIPYGQSLIIDDNEPIPAVHFQNRLVDRQHACYTCHTEYTMFGGVKAKINGLRHLYYHYIAGVPDEIKIAAPYPNRNCLSCHGEARSFMESENHDTDEAPLQSILEGKNSCLASGCHEVTHAVAEFDDYEFWKHKSIPVPVKTDAEAEDAAEDDTEAESDHEAEAESDTEAGEEASL